MFNSKANQLQLSTQIESFIRDEFGLESKLLVTTDNYQTKLELYIYMTEQEKYLFLLQNKLEKLVEYIDKLSPMLSNQIDFIFACSCS